MSGRLGSPACWRATISALLLPAALCGTRRIASPSASTARAGVSAWAIASILDGLPGVGEKTQAPYPAAISALPSAFSAGLSGRNSRPCPDCPGRWRGRSTTSYRRPGRLTGKEVLEMRSEATFETPWGRGTVVAEAGRLVEVELPRVDVRPVGLRADDRSATGTAPATRPVSRPPAATSLRTRRCAGPANWATTSAASVADGTMRTSDWILSGSRPSAPPSIGPSWTSPPAPPSPMGSWPGRPAGPARRAP